MREGLLFPSLSRVTFDWHCSRMSPCWCGFSLPGRIILRFVLKLSTARSAAARALAAVLSHRGPSKVSSHNEPSHRFRCASNPPKPTSSVTRRAYWWRVASRMFVQWVYVCTLARSLARSLLFWQRSGWNRVTLRLIRKLMHRKSRQRHCSPSARGAGENNLHIGRLMDTFIGSTGRGDGGLEEETERQRKGEAR